MDVLNWNFNNWTENKKHAYTTLAYTPSRPPGRVRIGWRVGGRWLFLLKIRIKC
jgi:hypothetical protein